MHDDGEEIVDSGHHLANNRNQLMISLHLDLHGMRKTVTVGGHEEEPS